MSRLHAVCFVALILGACGTYTYQNTHARQTLVPTMPASQWDDYVKRGGAFNVAR